jgi:hypothetical protein
MKTLEVKTKAGETQQVTAKKICEQFADETCAICGWATRSHYWYELANFHNATDAFLLERAKKMFPDAKSIKLEVQVNPW